MESVQSPGVQRPSNEELRRKNLRTGLLLGFVALAFFIGFFVKMGAFG